MTIEEIRKAVDDGKDVRWATDNYRVVKDVKGQYLIVSQQNQHCIGLTWSDNQTLNGKPVEFYIKEKVA